MGWPVPSITMSFTKKEGFKPALKRTEGVCLPDLNRELVPEHEQQHSESAGESSETSETDAYTCILCTEKYFCGVIYM